jgi:hypothetical protein
MSGVFEMPEWARLQQLLTIFVTMTTLAFASSAKAGNTCAQLLLVPLTAEVLAAKIEDLAKMKIQIDQNQAHRANSSSTQKSMKLKYPEKYQELFNHSKMSEMEFREKLAQAIAKNQKHEGQEEQSIQEARTREKILETELAPTIYKLKETQEFSDWNQNSHFLNSIAENGNVFYYDETMILRFYNYLTKNQGTYLADPIVIARVMNDGERLAVIDRKWIFHIYDIASREELHSVPLQVKPKRDDFRDFAAMDFSPSEERLLLGGNGIVAFDLKTGESIGSSDNRINGRFALYIEQARFINEEEAVFYGNDNVHKYNFTSQIRSDQEVKAPGVIFGFELSQDLKIISLSRMRDNFTLDANSLTIQQKVPAFETETSGGDQSRKFMRVASNPRDVFTWGYLKGKIGIYDQTTWSLIFDFNDRYTKKLTSGGQVNTGAWIEFKDAIFSSRRSKALILHKHDNKIYLDTWSL